MANVFIVASHLKQGIEKELYLGNDFAAELDKKVGELIKAACVRTKANNRKTVMAKDL